MFEVTCARCQKKIESCVAQKCGHCELEPLCETCIRMDIHKCGENKMEPNEADNDLLLRMIAAIDDLQIARCGPIAEEQDAFEILIAVRNDVDVAYYA